MPTGAPHPARARPIQGPVALELLRVRQWIKNLFVLAPLVFAHELGSRAAWRGALLAGAGFCLAASALYIFNDLLDRERDRLHPVKRERPLASGRCGAGVAVAALGACAGGAAGLAAMLPGRYAELLGVYVGLSAAYSCGLKRAPIAELMILAAGFVLRVMAGSAAIGVPWSHWMLLCTFLLAAFLGAVKRSSEMAVMAGRAPHLHRHALGGYSERLLEQLTTVLLTATVMSYALYTVASDTVAHVGSDRLVFSLPFVLYGMFRFCQMAEANPGWGGEAALAVARDGKLQACLGLWLLTVCVILYWP